MERAFVIGALVVAALFLQLKVASAAEDLPYLGTWSNGRGETLIITSKTLQFAEDKAVAYKDVTRATDGQSFELQITAAGKVNAFPGKTLGVQCEGDSMKMTTYASHAAYMSEEDPQSIVTWYKDDESGDDE